ncbi:hypothetical protein F2A31_07325 [Acinetobacter suaedae]|uniref:Uncharacterized protein n=1 Tax=Acinetobacter suaedae TaxID=2609668 RepID=A0A5P1UTM9_9GAMM|nr:hypothetical protein [Acinetobacter sp. C16S1]QER39532.1 hypothetical protein F2A31_07325 [Acinetobacter sp. C16S1]
MLSIISKHKILQSKYGPRLDRFFNILVIVMILSFFIVGYKALLRPVNNLQVDHVVQLSLQASHPKTQLMAKEILSHPQIQKISYLRLMHAYQFESNRIKQYPAMAQEDE